MVSNVTPLQDGLYDIHEMWKTDRATALHLLTDFHSKFEGLYAADEMVDMAHLAKRMDRQNNVNGGGNPTSVWTPITVRLEGGQITEGRLSELYPQGTAVPTYQWSAKGDISSELADADFATAKNPDNKTNAQGVDTAYEGKTWRDVVTNNFLGQAMEVALDAPTPEGFARVPMKFMSPPMDAPADGGQYTPLDLCWRNADGSNVLTAASYAAIAKHVKGFYEVCANEHIEKPEDVAPYVQKDKNYQSAVQQLKELEQSAPIAARAPQIIQVVQDFLNAGFEHSDKNYGTRLPRLDMQQVGTIKPKETRFGEPMYTLANTTLASLAGREFMRAGMHMLGNTVAVVFQNKTTDFITRFELRDTADGPRVNRDAIDGRIMDQLLKALAPQKNLG